MGLGEAILFSSLAGTAASTFAQSQAVGAQSRFQSQSLEAQQRLAELRAEDAIRRGQQESARHRRDTQRLIGSQRASLAAQGIDIETGSALEVQEDSAHLGALDALTIETNAYREAFGYRAEAATAGSQARLTRIAGRAQRRQTVLTGGLSMLRDLGTYSYLKSLQPKASTPTYVSQPAGKNMSDPRNR